MVLGKSAFSGLARLPGAAGASATPSVPESAGDRFVLANGRWITGRTDEALDLYGQAIVLADLDLRRGEEAARAGVPYPDGPGTCPSCLTAFASNGPR